MQSDLVLKLLSIITKYTYSLVRLKDFSLAFLLISVLSLFFKKLQCAAFKYSSAFFSLPSIIWISAIVNNPGNKNTESSPPSLSFSSVMNL